MQDEQQRLRDRVEIEQIRSLLNQSPVAIAAHLGQACGVVVVLWNSAPRLQLVGWLCALILAGAMRALLTYSFRRADPAASQWRRWGGLAFAVLTAYGVIWGAAAILFLDIVDPVSMIIIIPIIVGLFSASAAISAPFPPSFFGFGAAAYLPMLWVLLTSGSWLGVAIGLMACAPLISHPLICLNVHRELERSLRLGFENEALRLEAEQANAAKTRFLAAASHDLRQPIHALGLSFAALAERVRRADTKPQIAQIDEAIAAIDTMLNALLDVSKLDAGVVAPQLQPVSVTALLHRLKTELAAAAQEGQNRLRIRDCNAWVQTDSAMLHRMLANLLGNALRYTSQGRILLAVRRRGDRLRFVVYDTGIGIPEAAFANIFVEFHQIDNAQRDRRQGLGLGLSIVKRLGALLDHPIGLASTPGRGSCFWIEVPLTHEPPPQPAGRQQPQTLLHRLNGCRVLVLDDEPTVLASMQSLLERWGCEVTPAATIAAARTAARQRPLDLLIVDYRLSGPRTGLDAIEDLRRAAGDPVPALVITGDTAPERLREAQRSGYPLLHKPVQPARLRSAIQHLRADRRGDQRLVHPKPNRR